MPYVDSIEFESLLNTFLKVLEMRHAVKTKRTRKEDRVRCDAYITIISLLFDLSSETVTKWADDALQYYDENNKSMMTTEFFDSLEIAQSQKRRGKG